MKNINFDKYLDKFKKKVLPLDYKRRGIFLSEGFAICALCDIYKIDILIESGVANGRSTEIFAKYGIPQIKSIELAKGEKNMNIFLDTKSRLSEYKAIEFYHKDSRNLIPIILESNRDKNIAVILDGPKGDTACKFAASLSKANNLKFIALHDQHERFFDHIMDGYFENVFYTDDKDLMRFANLDEKDKEYIEKATGEKNIETPVLGIKFFA